VYFPVIAVVIVFNKTFQTISCPLMSISIAFLSDQMLSLKYTKTL